MGPSDEVEVVGPNVIKFRADVFGTKLTRTRDLDYSFKTRKDQTVLTAPSATGSRPEVLPASPRSLLSAWRAPR